MGFETRSAYKYDLQNDPADIRARANELINLVYLGPPGPLPSGADQAATWAGMIGPALLAKAAGTVESMILLLPSRRRIDAMTLLRALFENVVVLSWVAIAPDERLPRWYRTSYYWELQEHRDWEKAGGGLQTPEEVEELSAQAGSKIDGLPGVPTMAQDADEYWGERVPGWSPSSDADHPGVFSSLRGLYRFIYQRGSAAAHSRARGLDPFITIDGDVVQLHREKPEDQYLPYALALYTLGFGVAASEQSIGWPCHRQAARILGREDALYGKPETDESARGGA